jgi:hypothetical protein
MSKSTEKTMPGITNACSPQPRRVTDLSSAPDVSSTAPRNCAPRNCAPRNCAPRKSRRAFFFVTMGLTSTVVWQWA